MKFSLRPSERLKKRSQFRRVYKDGRGIRSRNFKLIFLKNNEPHNRIGLSIESRRVRLSSDRIRIKRLLRECYRLNKNHLKRSFDIVIIAGPASKDLGFNEVTEEMLFVYKASGLMV